MSPVDLRSDTLTRPSPGMIAAMASAEVGDDVYGEDPTLNALEERVADLFGHEAALFCPTGSMTNMLGVAALVPRGMEVLCDARAHIARAELGGHAAWFGVTMRTWFTPDGTPPADVLAELASPDAGPYLVSTAAIALENTHNFSGGRIQPLAELVRVRRFCEPLGIATHLDGARLWNAHAATGVPLADYGALFDTVSVCFSKGLGAPVGSVLVSSADRIAEARVLRKRLGGGMRQAGVLAAACDYALDHELPRLAEDHESARRFAAAIAERAPQAVDLATVQTNLVRIDTGERKAGELAERARDAGVLISAMGPSVLRAVTHRDVSAADCERAGRLVGDLLA
ncbi:threonine aldolase [Naumannella cuiyingiana]|uniref:Threonine aldolase n=1 Tax=Naumannella cuiyingiana TaxID=1347891 RepID=A0A7Z0DB37_9ACTN|nr:GntG family PLP-dependent aldolase [Naumannella cuiyingiana]NYI72061.1 threonine aldolase [Naumannella cuiyingiana]